MNFGEKLTKLRKEKEIVSEEYYFKVRPKIYLSKEIYEKIKTNNNSEKRCSYYSEEYSK